MRILKRMEKAERGVCWKSVGAISSNDIYYSASFVGRLKNRGDVNNVQLKSSRRGMKREVQAFPSIDRSVEWWLKYVCSSGLFY